MTLAQKALSVDDSLRSDGIDETRHNIKRAEKRERDFEEATRASSTKRFCFVLSVPDHLSSQ
jgi:mannose-6-phosphate isomerase-like protein (cupin superfamily)